MYSYEEKMRAVELYLKYGLSAAAVINELEQHIKKNKLPAKDQRVVLSHNNYIMVVVRLSATIRHFRLQSKLCKTCELRFEVVDSCAAPSGDSVGHEEHAEDEEYPVWTRDHRVPPISSSTA